MPGDMDNEQQQKDILMRNISRIQKSPEGCFSVNQLNKRHEIKKYNIDVLKIISILINEGLIKNGNKKRNFCLTHNGKLREHWLEEEYNRNLPYKVTRNKYDRR